MLEAFKEEIASHYTGAYCEVTVDRDPSLNSTGNGLSYRGLYTILVCNQQEQDARDKILFEHCFNARQVPGRPGLLLRNPGDRSRNGIDDYIYTAVASSKLQSDRFAARMILEHGRKYDWFFDDQNFDLPEPSSWLGRYLWFPAFLQLCSGERPGFLDSLVFAASMFFLPAEDNAGARLMHHAIAQIGLLGGPLCFVLAKRAIRKIEAMPGGMRGAAETYFKKSCNRPHPFTWPEVWHNA